MNFAQVVWPHTTWYAIRDSGQVQQLVLLYTGQSLPTVLAYAEQPIGPMRDLLRRLLRVLPRRFYAHLTAGVADVLEDEYRLQPYGPHYKMALIDPARVVRPECNIMHAHEVLGGQADMSAQPEPGEFPALHAHAVEAWETLAGWWDDTTGEADEFHQKLVIPATDRLLGLRPGERVLDVACGNGGYTRHLAAQGAEVVAFDAARRFVELAQQKTTEWRDRISYRHIDSTDRLAMMALGARAYDAAVCKMALMDMAVIHPLASALAELLKPGGRFVFSVLHPTFNSTGTSLWVEEATSETGELVECRGVKVTRYLEPEARQGIAILGQPRPQHYFHRPLSVLLNALFRVGFALDGIEEPSFGPEEGGSREFSWARFKGIPPVLVARMRVPAPPAAGAKECSMSGS